MTHSISVCFMETSSHIIMIFFSNLIGILKNSCLTIKLRLFVSILAQFLWASLCLAITRSSKSLVPKSPSDSANLIYQWLKVRYSRKQFLKFSFEPKKQQKYFCISVLASKSSRIKKI